jgi:peptidoglycan/LPS O-acetylase OafA/YrhL
MQNRYFELDSLRGIGVILVFSSHISLVTVIPLVSAFFSFYSPINMLFHGTSPVILFFILSGFVLYLPYIKGTESTYGIFIIKRFFRIYIPYLVSIILCILACSLISNGGIKELSSFFNNAWTKQVTAKNVLEHFLLIGNFNSDLYNGVIWYLVQEMRISIILPILAIVIRRFNWKISISIGLSLSAISGLNNLFHWQDSLGYHTSIFNSLHYISIFIIGCLIAKHLNNFKNIYDNLSKPIKIIVLLGAFAAFCYYTIVSIISNYLGIYFYGEIASDYCVALGTSIIILFSIFSSSVQKVLLIKPIKFLGKISFSLYLYHLPILFGMIHLFYYKLSLLVIYLISIPLAFVIAYFAWQLIEKPLGKYGKDIAFKIEAKQKKRMLLKVKNDVTKIG